MYSFCIAASSHPAFKTALFSELEKQFLPPAQQPVAQQGQHSQQGPSSAQQSPSSAQHGPSTTQHSPSTAQHSPFTAQHSQCGPSSAQHGQHGPSSAQHGPSSSHSQHSPSAQHSLSSAHCPASSVPRPFPPNLVPIYGLDSLCPIKRQRGENSSTNLLEHIINEVEAYHAADGIDLGSDPLVSHLCCFIV
jgi:hypothetical protein